MWGALGGIISAVSPSAKLWNKFMDDEKHKKDREFVQRSENYGREMFQNNLNVANTAVTRQVNDMRNAGINPIMGVAGGMSPVSSSSPGPSASGQGTGSSTDVGSALQLMKLESEIKANKAKADKDTATAKREEGVGKTTNATGDVAQKALQSAKQLNKGFWSTLGEGFSKFSERKAKAVEGRKIRNKTLQRKRQALGNKNRRSSSFKGNK